MGNLKVKVDSSEESKAVQDWLVKNGYHRPYSNFNLTNGWVCVSGDEILCVCNSQADSGLDDYKIVSFEKLKDMVVLKRNCVDDATHTDQDNWKWHIGEEFYVWRAGNSEQLKQWDKSDLDHVDLKPIDKENEIPWQRETLNDKVASAEVARQKLREVEVDLSVGKKFDNDKPRFSLLPKGVVNSVVSVLEFGAKKYDADNWKCVKNPKERYYNAAMRHIDSWWCGEKVDSETGIHHLAHAATNLFFLMWFDENGEEE